jgi:hypothetical protein
MSGRDRDDLFLETLEEDADLAWRLAEAAARPAPPALRERIVTRHRKPGRFGFPVLAPAALGLAVLLLVIVPLSVAVQTQAALERAQAQRDEYARVVAAVAEGARIIPGRTPSGAVRGGTLVVARNGQAYLVLDLPQPPTGKAYEAWVIRGGEPMRAGMAPVRSGIVIVALAHQLRPGDIAAVTLEDAAGVDRPTSDPVLMATEIGAG